MCVGQASGEYGAHVEEKSCLTEESSQVLKRHHTESARETERYVNNSKFTQTMHIHKLFIYLSYLTSW